nr:MFS transporter [Candidatus Paceibacterota bacterium]
EKSESFDWWGAITLGISLSSLVLVLDKGNEWGWFQLESLLCYAALLISLALFIVIEHREKEPIVDLKFFSNSVFVNTILNNVVVFMGMIGGVFIIPVFAQTFLGLTATQSGYLFMPMAFMMMVASPIGGLFSGKIEPRFIISVSTLIASFGIFLFTYLDPRSGALDIIIPLSIMAFGMGFGMAQRTSIITSVVPESEIGMASSVLALARNIAGAFGIAVFGMILNTSIENNLLSFSRGVKINGMDPNLYQNAVSLLVVKSQIAAYVSVFKISAAILLVGAGVALLMKIPKNKIQDKEVFVLD